MWEKASLVYPILQKIYPTQYIEFLSSDNAHSPPETDINKSTSFPNSNFEFGKGGEEEATTGWISSFLSLGTWYHPKTPQDTVRHHKIKKPVVHCSSSYVVTQSVTRHMVRNSPNQPAYSHILKPRIHTYFHDKFLKKY